MPAYKITESIFSTKTTERFHIFWISANGLR